MCYVDTTTGKVFCSYLWLSFAIQLLMAAAVNDSSPEPSPTGACGAVAKSPDPALPVINLRQTSKFPEGFSGIMIGLQFFLLSW
jgi:hypothetical protein